jgi:aspartate beta-hydroxylase
MLEANVDVIRGELSLLAQLTDVGSRSAHDGSLVAKGGWSEHVLLSASDSGVVHRTNRCPRTTELLLRIPELVACAACGVGEAIFSVLAPRTHLRPHCASSNLRLTCHLPLVVPPPLGSCTLRVGCETRAWTANQCLVFDDSFEHEVRSHWRGVQLPRVALVPVSSCTTCGT